MMIGGRRWPPIKRPNLACSGPQCDDDDGTESPPMNAAFAGKTPPPVAARFPNGSVKEVDVVECRLRTEILLYWSCLGQQGRKTKRLVVDVCNDKNGTFDWGKQINNMMNNHSTSESITHINPTLFPIFLQGDFSELLDKELILWLSKKPQEIVWGRNWKPYVWHFLLYDGWCLTPLFSCWIIFFKIRCIIPKNCLHWSEDACLRSDLGFQADSGFTYAFH